MTIIPYSKLRFLIADDFSNFRSTVNRMLLDLGAEHVDMASNGEELIERCGRTSYDVVLSDYNLGSGRNGQQVLEELRFKGYLSQRSVYILVSAESSRNIVMSSYDSAPDDYLMKPITAKMLQNRLERLLKLRATMSPVYDAFEQGNTARATELLIDMSIAEDRFSTAAQKRLGQLFLETGEFKKAEKLYMRVLEVRELDWARLGLAKAKHRQGELEQAGIWLEKIIEENYLYLPAYDALSDTWLDKGDSTQAQSVVQRSVEVSPMSILRQKNLARLASKNGDTETAVEALRKVVKLGRLSCYGAASDKLDLARAVSDALEKEEAVAASLVSEVMDSFDEIETTEDLALLEKAQAMYIGARLQAAKSNKDKALSLLSAAEQSVLPEESHIDVEVDHIKALLSLDYRQKVDALLQRLKECYAGDQEALEKLDPFLDEPASEANKAMVAEVNSEGIKLYNEGAFDQALSCFDRATQLFPKHIGLQLNVIQALIGKLKVNPSDQDLHILCRESLETINATIDPANHQYKRFLQLKAMAKSFYESA